MHYNLNSHWKKNDPFFIGLSKTAMLTTVSTGIVERKGCPLALETTKNETYYWLNNVCSVTPLNKF